MNININLINMLHTTYKPKHSHSQWLLDIPLLKSLSRYDNLNFDKFTTYSAIKSDTMKLNNLSNFNDVDSRKLSELLKFY